MFPVEGVGFVGEVTDELLGLGIDGEGDAEAGVDVLEAVGGEVFAHTGEGFGDRGVVLEGGIDLLRVGGFAEVEGMGAVVGEGGGEMAVFGAVEGALLAGEAGIDPVVDVVLAAFEFFDLLAVLVFHDAAGSVTAGKGAAFVFDDVADVDAFVFVHALLPIETFGGEAADFEEDGGRFGVEVEDLCVGGVAVIVVAEAAAEGEGALRELHRVAQGPAADVELVWSLVAEVAVAIGGLPVPVVVELLAHDRHDLAGSGPDIVVHAFRGLLCFADFADRLAWFVAEATGEGEFAEVTFLEPGEGFFPACFGAALEAVGDDYPVVPLTVGEFTAFPDVVGDGLFDVDVLAVRGGGEGDESVGVVASGDGDGIDVLAFTELAVVGEGFDLDVVLRERFLFARQLGGVDVAEGGEGGAGVGFDGVDVGTTAAFDADHGDTEFSIGSDGGGMGGEEGPSSGEDGGAKEVAAFHEFVEWCATCS